MRFPARVVLLAATLFLACGNSETTSRTRVSNAQNSFWASLQELCGQAFTGTIVESVPPDTSFADKELVMHVRECSEREIRIPFFVGEDRSRTWVISKTDSGLRLKHDHRHEDGTEDAVTMYGGDTSDRGAVDKQEFPADAHTASIVPVAATNVWTLEVIPEELFAYALRREGAERRFRVEFDLTRTIPTPPPPWGS